MQTNLPMISGKNNPRRIENGIFFRNWGLESGASLPEKNGSVLSLIARKVFLPLLLVLAPLTGLPGAPSSTATGGGGFRVEGRLPLEWSVLLARSEMKRLGNSLEYGGSDPHAHWDYTPAVLALSLIRLGEFTGEREFTDYGMRAVASHVDDNGGIRGYHPLEYNLDSINPGKVLLSAIARGEEGKTWTQAVQQLRLQIATQPRTSEGGYWHKKKYPWQMWLDSLYMASPFLAQYSQLFHEPALLDDVCRQIVLMDRHAYNPKSGLYYHGWDEKHAQSWADPKTGCSPSFWSRSIGWYFMAIVDCLDFMPADYPHRGEILGILRRVAAGVVRYQDPESGVWWQIIDQPSRKGNYLESSASSMFVYAMAKAVRKGYLPAEEYLPAIRKGYAGLINTFVREGPGGVVRLTSVCKSVGLGYTMDNGRPRDGSFDYYVSEPVVDNDPKGTGSFILAGIETQRLCDPSPSPTPSSSPSPSPTLSSSPSPSPSTSTPVAGRRVLRDLEYGRAEGEALLLDAHLPSGTGLRPVVLVIHGGGWTGGDKGGSDKPGSGADITPLFAALDNSPFLWCSMNYRLAPAHRWPACLEDVKTAVGWLKAHASEYGGDPSRIALLGHSAGGHLALLAGELPDQGGEVQAVVGIAPVSDHEQDLGQRGGLSPSLQSLLGLPKEVTPTALARLHEISPVNYTRAGLPPLLLVHGDGDKTVPFIQSVHFGEILSAAGVTCDLMTIRGAGHRLSDLELKDPTYPSRMISWIENHL